MVTSFTEFYLSKITKKTIGQHFITLLCKEWLSLYLLLRNLELPKGYFTNIYIEFFCRRGQDVRKVGGRETLLLDYVTYEQHSADLRKNRICLAVLCKQLLYRILRKSKNVKEDLVADDGLQTEGRGLHLKPSFTLCIKTPESVYKRCLNIYGKMIAAACYLLFMCDK